MNKRAELCSYCGCIVVNYETKTDANGTYVECDYCHDDFLEEEKGYSNNNKSRKQKQFDE